MKNQNKMPPAFVAVCDLLNQQKGIEARFTDFRNHLFFIGIKRRGTSWDDAPTFLCHLISNCVVDGDTLYPLSDPAIIEKLVKLALERS